MNEPVKQESNRESNGRWVKGKSGNPFGRPVGKTMKDYVREYLSKMTDEERDEFLDGIPKDIIWKMSEGMPQTNADITSGGKEIALFNYVQDRNNFSNNQDTETKETD